MGGTHAGPNGRVRLFSIRLFRVVALQVVVNGGWASESGVVGTVSVAATALVVSWEAAR